MSSPTLDIDAAAAGGFVAVVEDDPIMGESLLQRLRLEGYACEWWRTGAEALAALKAGRQPAAVVCDIRLPDMDGEQLYRASLPALGATPIIFATAFGDIEQAVRLVRLGADDYLTKPFAIDGLLQKVASLIALRAQTHDDVGALGQSTAMLRLEATLRRVRDIDSSVLLSGETGAGKEVAARFLHEESTRRDEPFVAVNCAAIPTELMDSELFGHEKGSFTGAHAPHAGFVEQAGRGTLFLDEIGELPVSVQAKLLRLLQERVFYRVGGERQITFAARLVCATNANLREMIDEGRFRKDLFFRLNVIELTVPPLRERQNEIVPLVRRFIAEFAERFERDVRGLAPDAEQALITYDWPGNVRELRNRVERAVALAEARWIGPSDLFPDSDAPPVPATEKDVPTLAEVRADAERRHIMAVLGKTEGQIAEAANLLGISRTTLWEKMRRFGVSDAVQKSEHDIEGRSDR